MSLLFPFIKTLRHFIVFRCSLSTCISALHVAMAQQQCIMYATETDTWLETEKVKLTSFKSGNGVQTREKHTERLNSRWVFIFGSRNHKSQLIAMRFVFAFPSHTLFLPPNVVDSVHNVTHTIFVLSSLAPLDWMNDECTIDTLHTLAHASNSFFRFFKIDKISARH